MNKVPKKLRKKTEKLQELYEKIPTFECKPGCVDCCGPVPLSKVEAALIGTDRNMTSDKVQPIKTKAELEAIQNDPDYVCPTCDYAEEGVGCTIYDKRPLTCRLYGTFERLACPHGYKPETMLTDEQEMSIIKKYRKIAIKEI